MMATIIMVMAVVTIARSAMMTTKVLSVARMSFEPAISVVWVIWLIILIMRVISHTATISAAVLTPMAMGCAHHLVWYVRVKEPDV